ncbi:MAG: glutamate 5-kinase [Actinomycetota bacterium]
MNVVVKIGTSSLTAESGELDAAAMVKLCAEVAATCAHGHRVILVSSGAIAAGLPALGLAQRPRDVGVLQAVAAVGQPRLMEQFGRCFGEHGLVPGQVLLTAQDFGQRTQYLHARETLDRLLDLGVVPVVNENDTVADDEIRYGDNDRLAALVAHLMGADLLVMLTDTPGVFTADPRIDAGASLIEEIVEVDAALEAVAGGAGTARGSGGMASKLAAAKIAAWSGIRAGIAGAREPDVLGRVLAGDATVGTVVQPRAERLPSRKLWIAFARAAAGRITVDPGARRALVDGNRSLLPAGVTGVDGDFDAGDAVEIQDPDGSVFAKGIAGAGAAVVREIVGRRTDDLPDGVPHEIVHRDDLVILPA